MSREDREKLLREADLAVRVSHNAVDLIDEAVCERLGVNRRDLRCLDVLERQGQMSAGELARATDLTTGAVTALVDRLEEAGYVRRVPGESDRRRVFVELTSEAQQIAHELYGPVAERIHPELERLSNSQLRALRDFHRRSTELMTEYAAKLRREKGS